MLSKSNSEIIEQVMRRLNRNHITGQVSIKRNSWRFRTSPYLWSHWIPHLQKIPPVTRHGYHCIINNIQSIANLRLIHGKHLTWRKKYLMHQVNLQGFWSNQCQVVGSARNKKKNKKNITISALTFHSLAVQIPTNCHVQRLETLRIV